MIYLFKYKRRFFWRSIAVIGHDYNEKTDKAVLHFADGAVEEIPNWKQCSLKLGSDWKVALQKYMEDKAGQPIPIKRS